MMDIDLIIKIIIPLLGAVITYLIIPFIKEKTTKEQREDAFFWVKVAVSAAEMVYSEKGQGRLKKEYVLEYLVDKGININLDDLEILIEAAVKELNILQEKALDF